MTELGLRRWTLAAIALALGGAALAGCGSPSDAPPPSASAAPPAASGRVMEISADRGKFSPATVEARPGETVTLRFTRTATSGCMGAVALPGLGIRRELPMNQPVDVTVTAPAGGTVPFECGMAMVRGQLVVVGGVATPGSTSPAPPATAPPHADHAPRHGGVVTMEGDLHVEIVVAADGAVDLYVSDSVRRPIPPSEVTGTLKIERGKADKQVLPLVANPALDALSVRAAPPGPDVEYTWALETRGQKTSMTLAVPAGGTAKLAGETGADEVPGASGGPPEIRRAFGTGQVALSLDPGGRVGLRLLDASGAKASARDVVAKIRAGGKEAPFAYDSGRDDLRAELGAVKGDHVDALVTITAPGGQPTSLRVAFHLESTVKKH